MADAAPSRRRRPLPGPGPAPQRAPITQNGTSPSAGTVATSPTLPAGTTVPAGTTIPSGAAAPTSGNTATSTFPRSRNIPVPRLQARQPPAPTQVAAAAGTAIVTAARVGRILGRSGWRIARQLPGAQTLEREAQRLQRAAVSEVRKRLDLPHEHTGTATAEERRAVLLVQNASQDEAPLRTAMSELLERSVETDRRASREYLFGTIISQLVPDEARILAALSDGRSAATMDVVIRVGARGRTRTELAYASTLGRAAGLSSPENTPTYLSRLVGFGLLQPGPEDESHSTDYEIIATDTGVRTARATAEARRQGSVRLQRGTVSLSPLGREFWAATDPSQARTRALPST